MRIMAASLIVLLAFVGVVSAQNCDPYLPCGPIPWQLPNLPDLRSPTPIPTFIFTSNPPTPTGATAVPTNTSTPTNSPTVTDTPFPTATLIPTFTPFVDTSNLDNAVGTLNALVNATAMPIYDLTGTPVSTSNIVDLTTNTNTLFGYIRGLAAVNFGTLTPLVSFVFTSIFIFFFIKLLFMLLPVFMAIVGFIRKVIEFILDLIPF